VRVHLDRVGMTPEMLTPAQPESRMQRSIFILPGSSPFVNAMAVLPAPEMQRLHPVNGPLTLDAQGLAHKDPLWFVHFAADPAAFGTRS